jgi:CHASE2 domain-containing sensor protein
LPEGWSHVAKNQNYRLGTTKRLGWVHSLLHHFAHCWASALVVASIITIAQEDFQLLAPLEAISFLSVSNVSSNWAIGLGTKPQVALVAIDNITYETKYQDKSPLYRCALHDHLAAIYAAHPEVVVIDIDLSPALWLRTLDPEAEESKCEKQLYDLIRNQAGKGTYNILMTPFHSAQEPTDPSLNKTSWQRFMSADRSETPKRISEHIKFADPQLPIEFGVLLRHHTKTDSLSVAAKNIAADPRIEANDHTHPREEKEYIDPRIYRTGINIFPLNDFDKNPDKSDNLTDALRKALDKITEISQRKRVVFFGGTYGQSDVWITPLGKVYGVEAHAAAYASERITSHHFAEFIGDWLMAILFAMLIAFCWDKFFTYRIVENACIRQLARFIPLLLFFVVGVITVFFWRVSVLVLTTFAVWLSPIATVVGMLIDSFVSGSVEQAISKLRPAMNNPHKSLNELLFSSIGGGVWRLYQHNNFCAAAILCCWNIIGLCLVIRAGFIILPH